MRLHILKEGAKRTISFLERANGRRPAEKFLETVVSKSGQGRILATLEHIADNGTLKTPGRLKKLKGRDQPWELRDGHYRIFCFHHQRHFFLVLGCVKKSDKHRRTHIKTAIRLRNEFLHHHTSERGE